MEGMDLNTCVFFICKIADYQYFMGILAIFNAEPQTEFICIYIFINRFMIFQKSLKITAQKMKEKGSGTKNNRLANITGW